MAMACIQSMQDQNVSLEVEPLMPNLAKESITHTSDMYSASQNSADQATWR